jgi:hypothetical protein
MFVLRPTETIHKYVCPACAARGEVVDSCPSCRGSAIKKHRVTQYYVQDKPIQIVKVDRDPETGVLRYWENTSEYYHETVYPELNKYVPKVPHGVHFCHDDRKSADTECARVNKYLADKAIKERSKASVFGSYDF